MKNLSDLSSKSSLFFIFFLKKKRWSVYNSVHLALIIIYWKILLVELLHQTDLAGAQVFHIQETTKVIVSGQYENFMLAVF